jgi:tetratricopeptide (TPR) repeat protein
LELFRASGDAFWTARAATNLGRCLGRLGDVAGAVPLLEEALALRRQLGDRRGVANTLHHLADALESSGQLTQARALAAEALGIAQAVGDRFVTVRAYIGLARVAYALDDLRVADEHLARAMAVAQRDGFGHEVAEVAILQGLVARQTGEPTRARALAELALCTARQHGRRLEAARALWLLGSLAAADARLDEARGWLGESLALYQQVPDPTGVALASRTLALLDGDDDAVAAPAGPPEGWTIEQHELERMLARHRPA